jgi:hypothetical protein
MAAHLGISPQSAGYVVKGYVDRVSFNQLINYMVCIEPRMTIVISLAPNHA